MTTHKSARQKGLYHYPKRIGKILGPWWYEIPEASNALDSTRSSGIYGKNNPSQRGDLAPRVDWLEEFPDEAKTYPWCLSVELKHDKSFEWRRFIQNPIKSKLQEWWTQCWNDGVKNEYLKAFPLLVFTKNYEKDYVMFDPTFFDRKTQEDIFDLYINTTFTESAVCITLLDNFVKNVSSVDIIEIVKQNK